MRRTKEEWTAADPFTGTTALADTAGSSSKPRSTVKAGDDAHSVTHDPKHPWSRGKAGARIRPMTAGGCQYHASNKWAVRDSFNSLRKPPSKNKTSITLTFNTPTSLQDESLDNVHKGF